jgi:hypothetical protein
MYLIVKLIMQLTVPYCYRHVTVTRRFNATVWKRWVELFTRTMGGRTTVHEHILKSGCFSGCHDWGGFEEGEWLRAILRKDLDLGLG